MRKKFLGIILAATCTVTMFTGCTTTMNYEEPEVDTLNEVHVFGEEEITAQKLFDGAQETIRYAKYMKVSGEYEYSYRNDIGVSFSNTHVKKDSSGPVEYEIYRDEDGNYSSILNGEFTWSDSYHSTMIKDADSDNSKYAEFHHYRMKTADDDQDKFICYGDDDICGSINIQSILLTDLNGKKVEKFGQSDGHYWVRLSGDLSDLRTAFGKNITGSGLLESASYYFDTETHELLGVDLSGYDSRTKESNNIKISSESSSFSLSLSIDELSNKPVELPEIPKSASDNGYINDVILNDREIALNGEIINPLDVESDFYSVAGAVWAGVLETPEEDRNTLKEIKAAIESAAQAYEIDEVNCELIDLVGGSKGSGTKGALIRFGLCSQGTVQGYIIIPIASETNDGKMGHAISLDVKDYAQFYPTGRMQFVHDYSPACQYLVQYYFSQEGHLQIQFSTMEEAKLSALTDQAEVMNFPEEDWKSLQKMASELDIARVSSITRYVIMEKVDDTWKENSYYVIDADLSASEIEEIGEKYSIDLVSQGTVNSKIKESNYSTEGNSVSWVQILDE